MTISQVCHSAGVRPPAVYYHFGSKEGLVGAVVEEVGATWLAALAASQPEAGTLRARIDAAVDGWQAMLESPARPVKLLLSVQLESADGSPEIRSALERVHDDARALIARSLAAVDVAPAIVETLADQVHGLVLAASVGFHLDRDRSRLRARLVAIGQLIETLVLASQE